MRRYWNDYEKWKRPLYGLNTRLGWPLCFIALVWLRVPQSPLLALTVLRSLAHQLIMELPLSNTLIPIALPTFYLWIVDTLALKRGTWVIESGTKLGWHLWHGLEIEYETFLHRIWTKADRRRREAAFFLTTNVLIVFGLIAFDNAFAILQTFHSLFPTIPTLPSPTLLVKALLVPTSAYDEDRIDGLQQALARLRFKSRSFYLASGVFQGRLRIDLISLYSFCRVADDLVDEAASTDQARHWIAKLKEYLDISYQRNANTNARLIQRGEFVTSTFPSPAQAALRLLPTTYLSPVPLYDLLHGFETDLKFSSRNQFPIKDEPTLQEYAARVAGTVAESCLELVFHHTTKVLPESRRQRIVQAGGRMGIALQYVNIARDISVDASNGRVYLPTSWLKEEGLVPEDILKDSTSSKSEMLRQRLLDCAFEIYHEAKRAIEELPPEARGPMRVAVESYMEIGRFLRKPSYRVKAGRATVPKLRRLMVAWNALSKS